MGASLRLTVFGFLALVVLALAAFKSFTGSILALPGLKPLPIFLTPDLITFLRTVFHFLNFGFFLFVFYSVHNYYL